jgi:enediyne biosynthesis protein E4
MRNLPKNILAFIFGLAFFCGCKSTVTTSFEEIPPTVSGVQFTNQLDASKAFRALYFFYYYNGGGVAAGDINNDGLTDLFFTANSKGNNKLYLNKGGFSFEDITETAGVAGAADWCTGVTMADVNNDGFLDIYVSTVSQVYQFQGHNELYINQQNGRFTESSAQYGLNFSMLSSQAAFFDMDHDGDLDCYLLNQSQKPAENLYDTSHRKTIDPLAGDKLLRNDISTTGKFTNVTAAAGIYQSSLGYGLGITVSDLNADGWDDIYIGNDFHENDYCYINRGDGQFIESGASLFAHNSRFSMGNDIADCNNDGRPDIITVDMLPPEEKQLKRYGSGEKLDLYQYMITNRGYQPQFSRNCLQLQNANGSFSDIALMAGVSATDWSWSPLMADFNNDGNKDLFISSGIPKRTVDMDYVQFLGNIKVAAGEDPRIQYDAALKLLPDGAQHNFLFLGDGDGNFSDASLAAGFAENGYHNGAAYADLDNDGDLDIIVNSIDAPAKLYRNRKSVKNYLQCNFRGSADNRFGIGTKIWLFNKGHMQYQQVTTTRGFQSASCGPVHFGLDSSQTIDSAIVVWPNQQYEIARNIPVNKLMLWEQKNAAKAAMPAGFFKRPIPAFTELHAPMQQKWRHQEDVFYDHTVQYLIPHQLSKKGPPLAIADINQDGREDFFLGGAIGQKSSIWLQSADGKFSSDSSLFEQYKTAEDVAAVFFDANGDGFADLYIASGGNRYLAGDKNLNDRFFLNNGKGHFTDASQQLPPLPVNKSTVSAGDLDGDGDQDLFIGVQAQPNSYGQAQKSFVLLNDGKGNFTKSTDGFIDLQKPGLVTCSAIADLNRDGTNELIIAGEWMPLTIFSRTGKTFQKQTYGKTGWWQSMLVADCNDDGLPDILAGNWGLNNKFVANGKTIVSLYVGDFDGNGQSDPVLAYTIDGKSYPFNTKDELEQQLPVIKKKFLYYADFAGKTVDQIINLQTPGTSILKAEELRSGLFINKGKSAFDFQPFDKVLQVSPVFCFAKGNNKQWIAGGNFSGVQPYEGAYDAAAISVFSMSFEKNSLMCKLIDRLRVQGEIRQLQWIKTNTALLLLAAENNNQLHFYKPETNEQIP